MGLLDSHPDKYLPRVDDALSTISHHSAEDFSGCGWLSTFKETTSAIATLSTLVGSPATGTYTLGIEVETDAAATWTFSEAPNASGGSAITGICTNRTSDSTDPLTVTSEPTYVSSGTVLENHLTSTIIGGQAEAHSRWTMAVSSYYLVRVVTTSGMTAIINLHYHGG